MRAGYYALACASARWTTMTKEMTKRLMKKSKEAALPLAVDMVAFAVPCLIPRRQLGSLRYTVQLSSLPVRLMCV